jgi:excinuclease UvrABC helicase subunit UvrB
MKQAARNLEFERAAALRDQVVELRKRMEQMPAIAGRPT